MEDENYKASLYRVSFCSLHTCQNPLSWIYSTLTEFHFRTSSCRFCFACSKQVSSLALFTGTCFVHFVHCTLAKIRCLGLLAVYSANIRFCFAFSKQVSSFALFTGTCFVHFVHFTLAKIRCLGLLAVHSATIRFCFAFSFLVVMLRT